MADLRGTGPTAASVPGSPIKFFDFERARDSADRPDATANLEGSSVGLQTVPDTGVVAEPIGDDPGFPTACVFSFDVATNADVKLAYLFSVGSVYFPVPLIVRADLEAADWVANIGVNPQ